MPGANFPNCLDAFAVRHDDIGDQLSSLRQGIVDTVLPAEKLDFDPVNLPDRIKESFEEAIVCHANGCYRAAALMVRRTLEEVCGDKGTSGEHLKARLKNLSSTIIIPRDLIEGADDLRLLGNDAAHIEARTYDKIGKEEVEVAIELAKEILKAVYQLGTLLARLRALRSAGES
jgi:hypothetical protein